MTTKKKESAKSETTEIMDKLSGEKSVANQQTAKSAKTAPPAKKAKPKKTSESRTLNTKKKTSNVKQPEDSSGAAEDTHVTPDHIVALRRRLNYEIFLKCLEKRYLLSEESEL